MQREDVALVKSIATDIINAAVEAIKAELKAEIAKAFESKNEIKKQAGTAQQYVKPAQKEK